MGDILTAEQRTKVLELELKQARAEAAKLRKSLAENSRHGQRVARAYDDALLLAGLHVGFQNTGRAASTKVLTRRRWTNAIALLQLARVYNCRRFTVHSLAEIETALQRAKRIAEENSAAYLARLPRHADDKTYRHTKSANLARVGAANRK